MKRTQGGRARTQARARTRVYARDRPPLPRIRLRLPRPNDDPEGKAAETRKPIDDFRDNIDRLLTESTDEALLAALSELRRDLPVTGFPEIRNRLAALKQRAKALADAKARTEAAEREKQEVAARAAKADLQNRARISGATENVPAWEVIQPPAMILAEMTPEEIEAFGTLEIESRKVFLDRAYATAEQMHKDGHSRLLPTYVERIHQWFKPHVTGMGIRQRATA